MKADLKRVGHIRASVPSSTVEPKRNARLLGNFISKVK